MPIKFLPQLRLLSPSLPVTRFPSMRPGASIGSNGSMPVLNRVFPFKLKFIGLSPGFNGHLGVRSLSTRSFRTRPGSSSEFTRKDRGDVRASKSLIEDEAELSDWVGELRTDSFRGRLTSEDEELDADRARNRVRSRDREGNRGSVKRRRESEFDNFRESNRRGTRGNPGYSFSRNSRFSKRFDSELEDEDNDDDEEEEESYSRRKTRGAKRENKKVDSRKGRGNERGLNSRNMGNGRRNLGRKSNFREDKDDDANDFEEERGRVVRATANFLSEEDSDINDDEDDEDDVIFRKNASSALGLDKDVRQTGSPRSSPGKSDSYLSESRFDQSSLSPLSLKGIKDAGYEKMTVVQEATLPVILKGKDVLAKAKTGTGKTVAFLLPSIEVVSKLPPIDRDVKRPPIHVLVICPTRELASQAAAEANTLLKYHSSIGVQVVIGGTRLALEQKRMQANPCQILVATPGRLRDHIENTAGFATKLMGVKVLVLDEADHLLDMGFRKDIERIIASVPKQRQTLLFSATVPEEVRQICHIALRRDHEFINTVLEGTEETHSQVRQMHMVAPLDKHFSVLYVLLKEHIADDVDYKVLVFCTTAMVTRLVADLLGELNLNVREIHSRKPQSYRTRVSDEFRRSKGLILVTSDVSARGVDYPDVTLVIQVGLPADRQQYIHRLGRTGRKGKEGQGILLLAPWEEYFVSSIKDLPITKAHLPSVDPDTKKKVERALSNVEMKNKEAAYQAWLGYYNSTKNVGRDKYRLVELANEFSRSMGLDNPPPIPKLVLSKMGLRNIPGLRSK
ncbi:PREDICTED: DEAD-box ATP-dependent RNA helicase 31 [Theobroma cacao]|uniref:ATP-dependent RNA helicase n=1 Tax=Theobroma cacao TaxID=3641 RepID=A0AB32VSQ8_THECC|nr:PREDICTED: DEAD-box ATP-dependent RNA helicase 31 [Theobroma cacao]